MIAMLLITVFKTASGICYPPIVQR